MGQTIQTLHDHYSHYYVDTALISVSVSNSNNTKKY